MPDQATFAAERRLFDIPGAVEYLRAIGAGSATVTFVRRLVCTGQVPHLRIGKRFYLRRESLDSWIESHDRRGRRP